MLHESDGMRTRRRRDTQNPQAERLPDTIARLVTFTVTAATRSGRTKTTMMRVLTTLLDHKVCPAREIAVLYAERWQIEIAFLHLKRTVRGPPVTRPTAWAASPPGLRANGSSSLMLGISGEIMKAVSNHWYLPVSWASQNHRE